MWFLLAVFACSEYDFQSDPDGNALGTCEETEPAAFEPEMLDTCASEAQIGTFTPEVEWTWTTNPISRGYEQIMAAPAVADVDEDGIPDVVFTAFTGGAYTSPGALVAISGTDGSTLWSITEAGGHLPFSSSGVAIGALRGNEGPTIVVSATDGLLAVDGHGAFRWFAATPTNGYGHPAIGDVDGDGAAEVVYGPSLVDADGNVRWIGTGGTGGAYYMSFPADLDEDGFQEIVAGNTVYTHDGQVLWTDGGPDGFPAVADLDGDGEPEVVRVGGGVVRASHADGTQLWEFTLDDYGGGPPTIADFDGDGQAEVGFASANYYRVLESDGTERWRDTIRDYSSAVTGSAVFDFEGDGAAEVIYADEETLWVFDGQSGAVEMAWDSHSSGTLFEYPLVVDVDADGSSEIIVASNDYTFAGSHGITAIHDANDSWAPARPVWNQHAYSIANVGDDGSIPTDPEPSWSRWNSFRAGNSETAVGLTQADLEIGLPDFCTDECTSDTYVAWVPVANRGVTDAYDVLVGVYERDGGDERRLDEQDLGRLEPGETAWAGPFAVHRDDFGAATVIRVTGAYTECDDSNNLIRIDDFPCGD